MSDKFVKRAQEIRREMNLQPEAEKEDEVKRLIKIQKRLKRLQSDLQKIKATG